MRIKSLLKVLVFSSLLVCLGACSGKNEKKGYSIAIDPSWYPINTYGKEPNILAFTSELLGKIAEREHLQLEKISVSWDDLIDGLSKKRYDAILNSMEPYVFNVSTFSFSNNFLYTGPVLVVREDATTSKLPKLHDKEIAIFSRGDERFLAKTYPDSLGRMYELVPTAFTDIIVGSIDGALVDVIEASAYVADIYQGKLKIITRPYTDVGLKLITLKDENEALIEAFNRGLHHLMENGEYEKLMKKWKIGLWKMP